VRPLRGSTVVMTEAKNRDRRSRPRFRLSQRLGRNLLAHPKGGERDQRPVPNPRVKGTDGLEGWRASPRSERPITETYGRRKRASQAKKARFGGTRADETRLDVLLHRSGLANSVRQARQAISHGHVRVDGKPSRPGVSVKPGSLVAYTWAFWSVQRACAAHQWSRWPREGRNVPAYLEVDYVRGSLRLVGRPRQGELLVCPA
jgi:ribosomal 50S subunit-recycling heat shock protein